MSSLEKKAEFFANIAIVLVALVLLAVVANKFWGLKEEPSVRGVPIGEKISVADINWAENQKTLVLVLQENCRFCHESMPFYKKLVEKSQTKLVAVFPSSVEKAKAHLKEQGVEIADVRQVIPEKIGISGTPTLILVDEQGKVLDSWVGKLQPEDEEKVLQKINCNEGTNCS